MSISAGEGLGVWLACWLGGQLLALATVTMIGGSSSAVQAVTLASVLAWTVQLAGLRWASQRAGSGRVAADYQLRFRPADLLGLPAGVLIQLAVVPVVYLPLKAIWPDTFTNDRLDQTARQLADSAHGGWLVVLVATVVIAAPIVEELLYRGLVQRSISNSAGPVAGWLLTAGLFTLIHFRPYEYLGLFAFSLIVGLARWRTDRLGPSIMIHIGFNAAGLALVLR